MYSKSENIIVTRVMNMAMSFVSIKIERWETFFK